MRGTGRRCVGVVLGSVLIAGCNAVLGIGEDDLLCMEDGCDDAGVVIRQAQPSGAAGNEAVPAGGAMDPSGRGIPRDGGAPDASVATSTTPGMSEVPAGSNATLPGDTGGSNPGSGSESSGGDEEEEEEDDDDDDPPAPPSPCQERASGEVFCSGATRISCGPGGSVVQSAPCSSAEHCLQGSGAACALCVASEVRCEGELLVSCNATGTGFETRRCGSAALCSATSNQCEPPACNVGESRCRGAELERCNASQTAFEPVMSCGSPQACDSEAGACDACSPGTRRCLNANVLAVCDASGQSETPVGCGVLEGCVDGECVPLVLPLL